jgi:hypothetical protein
MPEGHCPFLVALDQCGLELQGPHMLTRTKRLIASGDVDATALGRDTLRYHAWDPAAVGVRYEGLDPGAAYEIEATFACERSQRRVLALVAGGSELGEVTLTPAGATVMRVAVPGSAIRAGALDVAIERRAGPDAMVSELRLFSTVPAPPILTVVGDSRGGLVGTVCDAGYAGIAGAEVTIASPSGTLSVTTDARGLFRAPLRQAVPAGQHATLTLVAKAGDRTTTCEVDTRALALGLRELPPEPERLNLAGDWLFTPGRVPDGAAPQWTAAAPTRVPGHVAFDGLVPERGIATLRRTIAIPADWTDDAVFARFDGAYGRAEVFLNGQHAGTHSAGATSFDVDLTAFVRAGENALTVVLTEYTPHAVLDYMSWYAHTSLLGIWREACIFRVPRVHLGPTELRLDWDPAVRCGTAEIAGEIVNLDGQSQTYELDLTVSDGGRVLQRMRLAGDVGAAGSASCRAILRLPEAEPWSAEMPRLYDLEMTLRTADGGAGQCYRRRIGFRRVEVRDRQLLVNGEPIRLLGVNRHDARMRTGRSMRHADLRHDVLALREANVNLIRTAHYPADPRLLELCDELGMYVDDQMPICFAAGFDDHHWSRPNDAGHLVPLLLEVTAETVARDQRHPSVLLWDLANESQWGWGFDVQLAMVRQMDPGRPTLFSFDLNQLGEANPLPPKPAAERPDMRTYHYPGWDRSWQEDLDWLGSYDQPAVLSETFGPFQDNARAPLHADILAVDPGVRDYWVVGAGPLIGRAMRTRGVIGGMIWSAVDDQWVLPIEESVGYGNWAHLTRLDYYRVRDVHPPQDGLVFRGEGEWGLLDGWGRPRPELWHVHKLYSPIEIVSAEFAGDGRRLDLRVRNRHAHRPLETLEVRLVGAAAEGSGDRSSARLRAAPGEIAQLALAIEPHALRVEATFLHREGWVVDAFRWEVPGRVPDLHAAVRAGAEPLRLRLGATGEVSLAGAEPWLAAWPRLHVQDASHPLQPVPLPDLDLPRAAIGPDDAIRVPLRGGGWEGSLTVRTSRAGAEFEYACRYVGDAAFEAREIGLAFAFPAVLPDLWWDRVAEWPVYPDGHIGRPRGYARSAPGRHDPLHPAARWEDDTTPAGSNDYRGAKRHIRAAGVTDGRRSASVLSDGTQHVRARLLDGAPVLHVLDWYGGVPFTMDTDHIWTAHFGTGRRIERGTVLSGRVTVTCGSLPADLLGATVAARRQLEPAL